MSDEEPALAVGTLVAGKLRVVRALGIGGMGTVYEVEHELTRHRRALKLLHPQFATNHQIVARFLREASAAGRIGNPHIVETFDAGRLESGEPYLVMEMLDGRSLADILEDTGRVSEGEAVDWLAQACDGVQAAHDAGIIHRDLKPDNLFIQRSGRVKILDFGISKFDPTLTGEKQLTGDLTLGTPYYMAPEQTSKTASVDQRADVYALGVVLYECVTGQKPFEAETYPQLIVRIHLGDYPPASSVCGTSAIIDGIIAKAMARKPEDRFQTPAQLGAALREASLPTERTQSPFDSTQRAPELAKQPLPVTRVELVEPARTPVASGPTLLSAGSQPPPALATERPWALLLLAAAALAGGGAWWAQRRPTPDPAPAGPTRTSAAPVIELAPAPSVLAAPLSPPGVVSSAPRPATTPPATSKSAKPGTRAKEHALEEENPFR
jgi:eukaryotic-like serine/threonine-protein kinase